jgi:acetyltransferase-like isoleucine patch superfamily enzyme
MNTKPLARTIPGDWYAGTIPDNVVLDETACCESTFLFLSYRSEARVGMRVGRGATIQLGTMLDVGPRGRVHIGDYALVNNVRIVCDTEITIGNHALISWNVVLMDTYRVPVEPIERRKALEQASTRCPCRLDAHVPARPIHIGDNVWIGFDVCVLPGVTIGEGAIIGARSVVAEDVDPYTIVAGNPARFVRRLETQEAGHGS